MRKSRVVFFCLFLGILFLILGCGSRIPFKPFDDPTEWALSRIKKPFLKSFDFEETGGALKGYWVPQYGDSIDPTKEGFHLQKGLPICLNLYYLNATKIVLEAMPASFFCEMRLIDPKTKGQISALYKEFLMEEPTLNFLEELSGNSSGRIQLSFVLDESKVPEFACLEIIIHLKNGGDLPLTYTTPPLYFFINTQPSIPIRHDGQNALSATATNWSAVVKEGRIFYYWQLDPADQDGDLVEFVVHFSKDQGVTFEEQRIPIVEDLNHVYQVEKEFLGEKEDLILKIAVRDRYGLLSREISTKDTVTLFQGAGTVDNPFLITNLNQLNSVRQLPNAHYLQKNHLFFSSSAFAEGWTPIADFQGSYDGGNFEMKKVKIKMAGADKVGIFANTLEGAILKNIKINEIEIENTRNQVGALVGESKGDLINCHVKELVLSCEEKGGGLAGIFLGTKIERCSNQGGTIKGKEKLGGLVGEMGGDDRNRSIIKSFNQGIVEGEDNLVGGLVGNYLPPAPGTMLTIQSCYNIGTLILRSGASSPNLAGFVAGMNPAGIHINNCYSTSGYNEKNYFVSTALNPSSSSGVIYNRSYSPGKEFLFDGTKKMINLFASATFLSELGSDYQKKSNIKNLCLTENLQEKDKEGDPIFIFGEKLGTKDDPFLIATREEFQAINAFLSQNDGIDDFYYYKQTDNIGFLEMSYDKPLINKEFKGVYDGNMKELYECKSSNSTPFFHYIKDKRSVIKNITLNSVTIFNSNSRPVVGLLANGVEGKIENCHINDNCRIEGEQFEKIGGLAGNLYGSIERCSNRGAEIRCGKSKGSVGGLVGSLSSPSEGSLIKNCYNLGTIKGKLEMTLSGLVGVVRTDGGTVTVEGCYNMGKIEGAGGPFGRVAGFFVVEQQHHPIKISHSYSTTGGGFAGGNFSQGFFVDTTSSGKVTIETESCFSPGRTLLTDGTFKNINYFAYDPLLSKLGGLFQWNRDYKNILLVENLQPKEFPLNLLFSGGVGEESLPFLIKTKADFLAIDDYIAQFTIQTDFTCFIQENDIDFNNEDLLKPIIRKTFRGIYDGGNHKLSRAKAKKTPFFFNVMGEESVLKNIILDQITVRNSTDGEVVGALVATAKGTIENCHLEKNCEIITEKAAPAGGLVGIFTGTMEKCSNRGATVSAIGSPGSTLGGLVGLFTASSGEEYKMEECYNMGNLKATGAGGVHYGGGLIGVLTIQGNAQPFSIEKCYNLGKFSLSGKKGGFFTSRDLTKEVMVKFGYSLFGSTDNGGDSNYFVDSANSFIRLENCYSQGANASVDGTHLDKILFMNNSAGKIGILSLDRLGRAGFTRSEESSINVAILKENPQKEAFILQ